MRWVALIIVTLVAGALQPGAAEPEGCDNRAFFERILRAPAQAADADPNEHAMEQTLAALTDRVAGVCMDDLIASAEDNGGLPIAGDHLMLFEVAVRRDFTDLLCNQVPYAYGYPQGGAGGHYDEAVELPSQFAGTMPWSYGDKEYAGAASSRFSVAEDAIHTEAYVIDLSTGKSVTYAEPIRYLGVSDFYCLHYEAGFIHNKYNFNIPFLSGTVGPDPVPPDS